MLVNKTETEPKVMVFQRMNESLDFTGVLIAWVLKETSTEFTIKRPKYIQTVITRSSGFEFWDFFPAADGNIILPKPIIYSLPTAQLLKEYTTNFPL